MYAVGNPATMMDAYLCPLTMQEQDTLILSLSPIALIGSNISGRAQLQALHMPPMSLANQSTTEWWPTIQIYEPNPMSA